VIFSLPVGLHNQCSSAEVNKTFVVANYVMTGSRRQWKLQAVFSALREHKHAPTMVLKAAIQALKDKTEDKQRRMIYLMIDSRHPTVGRRLFPWIVDGLL
jgi:hypothetical protein